MKNTSVHRTYDKSFSLVGIHGEIQVDGVYIDFTRDMGGFFIEFNMDSKMVKKNSLGFVDAKAFLNYAEKRGLNMSLKTSLYDADVCAEVIVAYFSVFNCEKLLLEKVKRKG
jgi:hypothetical protein